MADALTYVPRFCWAGATCQGERVVPFGFAEPPFKMDGDLPKAQLLGACPECDTIYRLVQAG